MKKWNLGTRIFPPLSCKHMRCHHKTDINRGIPTSWQNSRQSIIGSGVRKIRKRWDQRSQIKITNQRPFFNILSSSSFIVHFMSIARNKYNFFFKNMYKYTDNLLWIGMIMRWASDWLTLFELSKSVSGTIGPGILSWVPQYADKCYGKQHQNNYELPCKYEYMI